MIIIYLDTIGADSPTTWMVTVRILDTEITFKVYTRAAVTAIFYKCYESLGKPKLKKPHKSLQGPDNHAVIQRCWTILSKCFTQMQVL